MKARRRIARAAAGIAAACVLAAPLAGCNIVGPIYALAAGPGEVKAAYKLDPDLKTVIFVDDPANKIAQRRIRSEIGVVAQDTLLKKNLVREGSMIDTRSAMAAVAREENGEPMAVTEIGKAVGAEVMIYVLVTSFELSPDGVDFAPASEVEVKIFDVANEARLWPPAGQPGYRSKFSNPTSNRSMPRSRTDSLKAQTDLAQLTGAGLAQLFYDVERPQSLRR
ncbi:MAG: hypothetical protein H6810_01370 [Phycisphaeraceae bacterium]|nr:MAG: hypothetical protein H6810_01370 [Phycisphaeraceae bacterium]